MKKSIILLSLALAALCGCSKLLDIPQQNVVDVDTYYAQATDAQAEALIAHIYREVYLAHDVNYLNYMNAMSDDGMSFNSADQTAQNHVMNNYFPIYYNLNYLSNLIIEKLADTSDAKHRIIGEAYFWRAWAYLNLIRGWGTPPLVDHVLKADEMKPANGTPEALWNYVNTSLDAAAERLPEKTALGTQAAIGGRVSRQAAWALKGKAQVLSGDYSGAIGTLEKVMDGKYKLIPEFGDLYHLAADFCDEYIWEFNANDLAGQETYRDEGDTRVSALTWNSSDVRTPGGFETGAGTLGDIDKNLYDFFVARGEQGKARYNATLWNYEEVLDRFVALGEAANRTAAIGLFWVGGTVKNQGYFRSKMLPTRADLYDYPYSESRFVRLKSNWPGMRYAEVLLLYAEACAQSGTKTAEGKSALDAVRQRAGLGLSTNFDLKAVQDEKRAELAFEGERYYDIVRWGLAGNLLKDRGLKEYVFKGYKTGTTTYNVVATDRPNASGFQDREVLFPFPASEDGYNDNLNQNNGWK